MSPAGIQDQVFKAPGNTPLNELRNAIVPGNNFAPNPIPGSDWTAYVNAFKNWASNIEIVSTFNGSPVQPRAALSVYRAQYDAGTDSFWLVPDNSQRRDVDGLHQHLDAGPDQQRLPADRQVARLCRIEDGG